MRIISKTDNRAKALSGSLLAIFCCIVAMSSCNKNFEAPEKIKYNNDTSAVSSGKSKVLYIILDGVRGSVLSTMKPANIVKINKNATYTFNGLNDSTSVQATNAGSWADMLTGVPSTSHKITSENFAGNQLASFPSIFTRLKQINSGFKSVSLAASASFDANLAADATERSVFTTDAAVQAALKTKISTTNADLIVAEFNSADAAGAAGGYNVSNVNYTNAITTLDGYLGEAVNTLKARTSYAEENWLVIIASNKGGVDSTAPTTDGTLFGNPTKNTYVALYNPAFDAKVYTKPNTNEIPYAGKAPRFVSDANTAVYATLANAAIGNFGTTGNFTLMFKFRNDYGQASYYPVFLGKRNPFNSVSSTGWGFLYGENSAQLDWNGTTRPGFGIDIRDAKWHTVAFTISQSGTKRNLFVFVDGVKRNTAERNEISGNPDNTIPLRIGAAAGTGSDQGNFLLTDLAIFNVAIPDNDLINNMKKEVNTSNPYFANLLGWWPCNEGNGFVLKDRSGKGNDFSITGNVAWTSYNDLTPNITPSISGVVYRYVPNGVDLPFTIYNWFKLPPPASWNLTGRALSPNYLSLSTN